MKPDLDRLLRQWPAKDAGGRIISAEEAASSDDDARWNAHADLIMKAVASTKPSVESRPPRAAIDALFDAPLPAEPEEGARAGATSTSTSQSLSAVSGDRSMSKDDDASGSSSRPPRADQTPVPSSRTPRPSLKDLAVRASQRPAQLERNTPVPSAATPIPSAPRSLTPLSQPVIKPIEAKEGDSGVVNLNALNESATAEQKAAAEKAKPGDKSLFEDDAPRSTRKAANDAKPASAKLAAVPAASPELTKTSSGRGVIIGLTIAALGVAAAIAISMKSKPPATAQDQVNLPTQIQAAPSVAVAQNDTPKTAATAEEPKGVNIDALPDDSAKPKVGGPLVPGPLVAKDAPSAAPSAVAAVDTPVPKANGGPVGDLQSEMEKRAGGGQKAGGGDADPSPASGPRGNQTIPEQPSQGAVQGAIGVVMGGAKSCVSGADDVTRAQVTFSSSGAVTSVSVSGWAASNGQAACVKSALQGAKVGAFSKPSYTAGVTIRP